MATDLLTRVEYLQATGQNLSDLDTPQLARIDWAVAAASGTVRSVTDRDFTLNSDAVQAPKTYVYEGHSQLEIDDCTTVNTVSIAPNPYNPGRVLDVTEWFAMPVTSRSGIKDYIEFFTMFLSAGISPEMGFKSNLDNYPMRPYPVQITVDAVWGWPSIPNDVKQAMVWAVADFMSDPSPYASESIETFHRAYASTTSRGQILPGQMILALPDRALALLDPYTRLNI